MNDHFPPIQLSKYENLVNGAGDSTGGIFIILRATAICNAPFRMPTFYWQSGANVALKLFKTITYKNIFQILTM